MTEKVTASKPKDVDFVAVRKVCTADGVIVRPGEKGAASKETVQKWLDIGAVKITIPE